jgi:hypothetical protein
VARAAAELAQLLLVAVDLADGAQLAAGVGQQRAAGLEAIGKGFVPRFNVKLHTNKMMNDKMSQII